MNSIVIISMMLVVLCTSSVNARVYGGVFRHPEHPGKCHFGETILEAGEILKQHEGECALVTCFDNGHASIMKCVPQKMRDGCHEEHVLKPEAPYPDCCKREIKCKDHYYSGKD